MLQLRLTTLLLGLGLPGIQALPAVERVLDDPAPAAADDAAPATELPAELRRIAVVGASASAGFQLQQEVGAYTHLGDVLAVMIRGDEEIDAGGSSLLFTDPLAGARKQIERATEFEPTLVVGVDFLFWFSYGWFSTPEARYQNLERGFRHLESFECPIVVGDIPDMRGAVGKMLFEHQVPSPETLEEINRRIVAWAGEREDTHVVPLAEFTRRALANETLRCRATLVDENAKERLMQPDDLHPTLEGLTAVAVLALDALYSGREEQAPENILWDATALAAEVYASKAEERAAAEERARRREERRRQREAEREAEGDED